MTKPTFYYENKLRKKGYKIVAGIDEAGRGSLAGPVVAAAVILNSKIKPYGIRRENRKLKIRDSKLLSPKQRIRLFEIITKNALAWGIGKVSEKVIDQKDIAKANKQAISKALKALKIKPDYLLLDGGINLNQKSIPSKTIIKGDTKVFSIACASILAKVQRDRMMAKMDKIYPRYEFSKHKGYGTKSHLQAITKYGPCLIHRKSFAPIKKLSKKTKKL